MCLSFAVTLQNQLAHAPPLRTHSPATLPSLPCLPERPEAKAKVLTDKKCRLEAGKDFARSLVGGEAGGRAGGVGGGRKGHLTVQVERQSRWVIQ